MSSSVDCLMSCLFESNLSLVKLFSNEISKEEEVGQGLGSFLTGLGLKICFSTLLLFIFIMLFFY